MAYLDAMQKSLPKSVSRPVSMGVTYDATLRVYTLLCQTEDFPDDLIQSS